MGWDEKIFGIVYRTLRRKKGTEARRGAVVLEPIRARLTLFGAAVARKKIEIGVAEREGGRTGVRLLLPEALAVADTAAENERAYLLRVALDATALRIGLEPERPLSEVERVVFALLALPVTLRALDADLPGVRELFDGLAPYALAARPSMKRMPMHAAAVELLTRRHLGASWAECAKEAPSGAMDLARGVSTTQLRGAGSLMQATAELAKNVRATYVAPVLLWGTTSYDARGRSRDGDAPGQAPDATGTERKGKVREGVRVITLADDPLEDNPLIHSFEKVHTAEEYSGGRKNVDGSDEMSAHGDALDEVEMREVVRSRERAHSLYRAEVTFGEEGADVDLVDTQSSVGIAYDEWDERTRSYRKQHCHVFVTQARQPADLTRTRRDVRTTVQKNARQIRDLESRFDRIERSRRERGRQPDGTDIDVDAMVERRGALAAGHTGEDRLYVARRPHVQDLAVLILLDASLSSDAWVAGRRVLDVAKEAVVVLGEALSLLPVQTSVAAFFSNTRRDCRFVVIKSFDASWEASALRLATVAPTAYTRIGPALRHGAHVLEATGARRKLLLMVGDGKPTDFDRYEGRYGIGDVRQAVREAEQGGVHTFALAIDASARRHLPQMFGPKGFEVLSRPEDLVGALGRVCADLAR